MNGAPEIESVAGLIEGPRPKLLLCATMWWPLSARLAIALLRQGCRVCAVCPPGHPLRFVHGIDSIHLYRGLNSLGSLLASIRATAPSWIVPCDDGAVWQLHELHRDYRELRPLIERSLGDRNSYQIIRSRASFLRTAVDLGIRIPETVELISEASIPAPWCQSLAVLKQDGTWGGSGVVVVSSLQEARAAFRKLSQPIRAQQAWKRWLINRDPIALWLWKRQQHPRVTMQRFIEGPPANSMMACRQGKLLVSISVEVLSSQGATGAATVVRRIQNQEIDRVSRTLAEKLNLSGFHGLDFVLEKNSGAAYLIELNPRCTQLGHLQFPGHCDLAAALCESLTGQSASIPPLEECIASDEVAFFPQALNWNPASRYLRRAHHDVPWEELNLVRELLRKQWPERQWLNRIYHHFRPVNKTHSVEFQ